MDPNDFTQRFVRAARHWETIKEEVKAIAPIKNAYFFTMDGVPPTWITNEMPTEEECFSMAIPMAKKELGFIELPDMIKELIDMRYLQNPPK